MTASPSKLLSVSRGQGRHDSQDLIFDQEHCRHRQGKHNGNCGGPLHSHREPLFALALDDLAEVAVTEHPAVHLLRRHGEEERRQDYQIECGNPRQVAEQDLTERDKTKHK